MAQDELRREQIEYIKKLPVRTVNVGEKRENIACDFEKKIAYFLDERGNPIGKAIRLDDRKISQLSQQEKETQKTQNKNSGSNKASLINFIRKLAGASDEELQLSSPLQKKKLMPEIVLKKRSSLVSLFLPSLPA